LSKQALRLMLPGAVLGLHWICFYGSIRYANVSIALTCLGAAPLLAAVFEPLSFRRGIQGSELVLGSLVAVGIAIIYASHLHFSLGLIYGVLAVILTVAVSILNKHMLSNYAPGQLIGFQMTGAFLAVCLCFPVYTYVFQRPFEFPTLPDLAYLLVLSWACTILTFFLWMLALKQVSAFTSNILLALEPIYGIILAFLVFKEYRDMGPYFYVGFLLMGLAVGLHTYKVSRV